jgi:hypothetical protein
MPETIQETRKKITQVFGHFDLNRLHELRQELGNYQGELHRLSRLDGTAEQIAEEKLRLANAALRLQQIAIPELAALAESALEIAGTNAVNEACRPTRSFSGKDIPSEFKVPSQFGGIVGRVKTALVSR